MKSIPGIVFFFLLLIAAGCNSGPQLSPEELQAALSEARNLGLGFLEENRLDDAEIQFRRLIELAPDDAAGYANLGIVHLRRGELSAAEENLQKAIERDAANIDIKLNLAHVFLESDKTEQATEVVLEAITQVPDNVPALYKYAELLAEEADSDQVIEAYQSVVNIATANIVPRIQLLLQLISANRLDEASFQALELQNQLPALPEEIQPHINALQAALKSNQQADALRSGRIFHNLMKVTPYYQAGVRLLGQRVDALGGIPVLSEPTILVSSTSSQLTSDAIIDEMAFSDATTSAGLSGLFPAGFEIRSMSHADINGDGETDIFLSAWNEESGEGQFRLLTGTFGSFSQIPENAGLLPADSPSVFSIFSDYNNDTFLDLYVVNEGKHQLFESQPDSTFRDVSESTGIGNIEGGNKALFLDFDHDGDLDLLIAKATSDQVFRNNADGTFSEINDTGLSNNAVETFDTDFGDFDDDGDIDLITSHQAGVSFFDNQRQGVFEDRASLYSLEVEGPVTTTAVGDYNNDGFLDLFIAGSQPVMYLNVNGERFERDTPNDATLQNLAPGSINDALFTDVDNDGFLDLIVSGDALVVLHNNQQGQFSNRSSSLLPPDLPTGKALAITDYNLDRDIDLFFAAETAPVLLRNDGGHLNRTVSLQTRGLLTNNSKNNYFSIGAKVEMRSGDLYQMRVVTQPVTYFGLGQRVKADVVRIVFTNGVPQNIFNPGTDQDILEQQILKGSCPFLYTWNGEAFDFATDILWRSALGMPTGIMGGEVAYAPASPAEDYVMIPGNKLKVRDGKYDLRVTAELWETPYFDEIKLLAVDHPDSVDVFLNERFGPPPSMPLPVYGVSSQRYPASATNGNGEDLTAVIEKTDGVYTSVGRFGKYQGLTSPHQLSLSIPTSLAQEQAVLYLKGWIFPTDASINIALSQNETLEVNPPRLEVKDASGNWRMVIPNIGFPMGKNKIVRVDLSDKLSAGDQEVRITTNMQIHWDQVFFAEEVPTFAEKRTILSPTSAALQYRGFSTMYRESPEGPHLFDYQDVSTDPKWLDLEGRYTRYGDILPLLDNSDDQYVIMNAGDEMAISFDAAALPALPAGWQRDFILYSNGWLKDGDLNTAYGNTVAPLPFKAMTTYPYGTEESYPLTESNKKYLKTYNTRTVDRSAFKQALKP